MTIHFKTATTDNAPGPNNYNLDDASVVLKKKFIQIFQEKESSHCQINWLDEGTVEIEGASPTRLHTFTLQAEAMGKQLKYKKKNVIEIL